MRAPHLSSRKRAGLLTAVVVTGAMALSGSSTVGLASRSAHSRDAWAHIVSSSYRHLDGDSGRHLHFDVRFSPFTLVDVDGSGPHNFTAGDEIVFHDRLLRRGHLVGDEGGSCVVIDGAAALANCTGVIRLPKGLISYQFLNEPPPDKTFVITGGTGRYLDVGGTGYLHEDATGPTGTLTVTLVGARHHR
jgi:Allene oxide cyclase barrel like domain